MDFDAFERPDLPLPGGVFGAVTGNFVINAMGDSAAARLHGSLPPLVRTPLTDRFRLLHDSASDRHGRGVLKGYDDIVGRQPEAFL